MWFMWRGCNKLCVLYVANDVNAFALTLDCNNNNNDYYYDYYDDDGNDDNDNIYVFVYCCHLYSVLFASICFASLLLLFVQFLLMAYKNTKMPHHSILIFM